VRKSAFLIVILLASVCTEAQLKPIQLPAPHTSGGRPLMEVLKERRTRRELRGSVDRPALAKVMKLTPNQEILLAQSVGYPK
jgi:hypothetical protein